MDFYVPASIHDSAREGGADLSITTLMYFDTIIDSAREGGADLSIAVMAMVPSVVDSAREGGADLSAMSVVDFFCAVRLRPRGRGGFKLTLLLPFGKMILTPPARAGRI